MVAGYLMTSGLRASPILNCTGPKAMGATARLNTTYSAPTTPAIATLRAGLCPWPPLPLLCERAAVFARVAATRPDAVVQDADKLGASCGDHEILLYVDVMTSIAQARYLIFRDASFDEEHAVLVTVAGMVGGLLWVHAVVEKVDEYLRLTLGLHRGAHYAENGPQGSFSRREAGDDGVHRVLPWSDGVRVARFEAERVAAVVETDTGAFRDYTAAEATIEAVDERAAVALCVNGAEVGSIARWVGRRDHRFGVVGDRPAQPCCVVFGEQLRRRHLGEVRVSYLVVQIFEGQLLRFDLEVDAVRARGSRVFRSNPSRMLSISSAATPWPGGGTS